MASTQTVDIPQDQPPANHAALIGSRLIVGLIQGTVLYLLYLAEDNKTWPSTDPYWMSILALVALFVPLLFIQAVGTMRGRTLLIWTGAAAAVLALLAWCNVWGQGLPRPAGFSDSGGMTFALVAFTVIGLFIAQSLITAGDIERKYVASYAAYFEAAWKLEIQLLLSAVFVGVFWGVLWLGATLFNLIGIHFIEDLITKAWFAIPASALATAAALHATDVRARLVAGIRTVAHTLLSWLLPLMVLIAVGFTLSLIFTGLAPLWATRSAASYVLIACGVLVVLINAAFQDGDPQHNHTAILRWSEFAAALVLVPLVLIATYALWLRVDQYGWTIERIATAATILVALVYAFGYAGAALLSLRGGIWMGLMARVNVAAAFLVLGVLLLLFTPIADPMRLAINSQVARLHSGAVRATAFDYDYLRTEGGRYGQDALKALAADANGTVRKMASAALNGQSVTGTAPPAKADIAANLTIYPATRHLPAGFADEDWSKIGGAPGCLTTVSARCDVYFGDFDGDGTEDVILTANSGDYFWGTIFKIDTEKHWRPVANLSGNCTGMVAALRHGNATLQPPRTQWRDWVIEGVHIHPAPISSDVEPCPG